MVRELLIPLSGEDLVICVAKKGVGECYLIDTKGKFINSLDEARREGDKGNVKFLNKGRPVIVNTIDMYNKAFMIGKNDLLYISNK